MVRVALCCFGTILLAGNATAAEVRAVVKQIPVKPSSPPPSQDTSRLTPLTDLGPERYQGFEGGLYPDGRNDRPAEHEAAGIALAGQVRPLGPSGAAGRRRQDRAPGNWLQQHGAGFRRLPGSR